MLHYVYLARCSDGSLYAGTCIDPKEREAKHNEGKGAKYTRSRRPVRIVYLRKCRTLSFARKREVAMKKMTKGEKEKMIVSTFMVRRAHHDTARNDTSMGPSPRRVKGKPCPARKQ